MLASNIFHSDTAFSLVSQNCCLFVMMMLTIDKSFSVKHFVKYFSVYRQTFE